MLKLDSDSIDHEGTAGIFHVDNVFTKCSLPGCEGRPQGDWSNYQKISCMSPDGSLVSTLFSLASDGTPDRQKQELHMLAIPSAVEVFKVALNPGRSSSSWAHVKNDKYVDLVNHEMGFSPNSALFWVRSVRDFCPKRMTELSTARRGTV